jgi:uncharacterized protein (TIGR02391 family)
LLPIKDIHDLDINLALHKVCKFLEDDAWNMSTSSDNRFNAAVDDTREYETEVVQLAAQKVTIDLYGNMYVYNSGYIGDLCLDTFLETLYELADMMSMQTPLSTSEIEFLHYYEFLRSKLPKPPEKVKPKPAAITLAELHPKILEQCRSRFNSKHYADAILAAYKVVLNEIKDISGIYDLDGKQLIEKTFSLANPIIKLNPLTTQSDRDEQLGFMMLFSGAAVGIRNPKAHDLVVQEDKQKTLFYLAFASLLMQRLDESYTVQNRIKQAEALRKRNDAWPKIKLP